MLAVLHASRVQGCLTEALSSVWPLSVLQVKLADFGVALKLSDSKQSDLDVVGSPYWMAPEIIEMNGTSTPVSVKLESIDHTPTTYPKRLD